MHYRTLGRTGIECSVIGLGTWAFASQVYGDVPEQEAHRAVRTALDLGINVFDSAPLYGIGNGPGARDGVAEEVLGRALGSDRDKVVISTKFGRNPSDGCGPNFHAQRARESVEASLRRMGTDRIDILFFHSPFSGEEIHDDVWDALAHLKQQGKIRSVGHSISKFPDTQHLAREWVADGRIDVIQVVYSLMNREAAGLIDDLGAQGCGIFARETLANGFLTGAITRETEFPPNNLNARYTREEIIERVNYVEQLGFLVRGEIRSMAQAALRWVLDTPHVTLALTGAKNVSELEDCARAADAPSFSAEERARADALHTRDYAAA